MSIINNMYVYIYTYNINIGCVLIIILANIGFVNIYYSKIVIN